MSDPADEQDGTGATDESPPTAEQGAAERARRRARVFGTVLPETTRDEQDDRAADRGDAAREEWLRGNVPPHH